MIHIKLNKLCISTPPMPLHVSAENLGVRNLKSVSFAHGGICGFNSAANRFEPIT